MGAALGLRFPPPPWAGRGGARGGIVGEALIKWTRLLATWGPRVSDMACGFEPVRSALLRVSGRVLCVHTCSRGPG